MFLKLGHVLLCLALFAMAGGHWVILQGVAWSTMIVEYSRIAPVTEAVQKTFSGEAPCPLCLSIAKAKQEENREKPTAPAQLSLDKIVLASRFEFPKRYPSPSAYMSRPDALFPLRSLEPSVPVPIQVS